MSNNASVPLGVGLIHRCEINDQISEQVIVLCVSLSKIWLVAIAVGKLGWELVSSIFNEILFET